MAAASIVFAALYFIVLRVDLSPYFPSATNQRDLAGLIRAERNVAAVRAFEFVKGVQGHHEDCSSH
jgi:hypothetical protein